MDSAQLGSESPIASRTEFPEENRVRVWVEQAFGSALGYLELKKRGEEQKKEKEKEIKEREKRGNVSEGHGRGDAGGW